MGDTIIVHGVRTPSRNIGEAEGANETTKEFFEGEYGYAKYTSL